MTDSNFFSYALRRLWTRAAAGALLGSVAGCALIHHDTPPVAQIDPAQIRLADDLHLARDGWPAARWWTSYQDTQLNALIDQALAQAPTIAMARERVTRARAQVDIAKAVTGLQIGATASIDRERVSEHGFLSAYAGDDPPIGADGPNYTSGLAGLAGHWDLDLWGRDRARVAAAMGVQNANRADEAAAEIEISTDVAQLYYAIQTTYASLALLQQEREIAAFSVETHAARNQRGLEAKTAEQEAEAGLRTIERSIVSAQGQVVQDREALRALIGAHADGMAPIAVNALPPPQVNFPGELSYELLARRPDLQALRWYVVASFDEIDAAKAAFYPSFDINVFFGFNALRLADLFTHASQQINLIPGLTLPIFDSGRLNADLHSARSASNLLIDAYNQAVLNAVRDVAQTGNRLQDLAREQQLQIDKTKALSYAGDSADAQYQRGLADKLTALQAQQPVLAEKLALVALNGQEIGQEIALVKELGGGYRAETPASVVPR